MWYNYSLWSPDQASFGTSRRDDHVDRGAAVRSLRRACAPQSLDAGAVVGLSGPIARACQSPFEEA